MSSGYPEGKHDDPADTLDRLVRIGTKYQATAPAVADGDNAYLLVDAAGRPIIVGPAAEDAAVVGNPLLAGGPLRRHRPHSRRWRCRRASRRRCGPAQSRGSFSQRTRRRHGRRQRSQSNPCNVSRPLNHSAHCHYSHFGKEDTHTCHQRPRCLRDSH